jgi:hypothetical protein
MNVITLRTPTLQNLVSYAAQKRWEKEVGTSWLRTKAESCTRFVPKDPENSRYVLA